MNNILFLLLLLPILALSQNEKGISSTNHQQQTYAVVVGISDYQDADIPDLRFADRDAEAFANFLRSPAGGLMDGDHLKLLTNEKATGAQFAIALDWLMEVAHDGDQAIIYFSGHGDVEAKRYSQPGYLLGWDAPSRVYMTGGTVNVRDLQDIISTLSLQNKAKVVVITDACHSGKLSGSAINGTQLTSANLAQQAASEIKILSCQADEVSIEGEQWGGGRGAFSFNLVDALYGMADANDDLLVSLKEVGRYLEDHVSAEVAPVNQNPKVIGSPGERLATVNPDLLAAIRSGKTSQMLMLSPVASRGMEDEVLAGVDTTARELYRMFKQALKDKVFLSPATDCADVYYGQLIAEPKLARLHSTMTRNYAAALQDDAQQVMNKWMKTDYKELFASKADQALKYEHYPRYLERAAELLGPEHYMYPILQARRMYFEGYVMHIDSRHNNLELGEKILAKYREALQWQTNSPHVYYSMMVASFYQLLEADSAEYYARRATELAPSWISPYSMLGFLYSDWTPLRNLDKTRHFLELADQIDTTAANANYFHVNSWALYYKETGQNELAEVLFKKMIVLDPTMHVSYHNYAILCLNSGRHTEAEGLFKKTLELDSTDWKTPTNLGILYKTTGRYAEAEMQLKKAHQLDPTSLWPPMVLSCVYIREGRFEEAGMIFKEVIEQDSMFFAGYISVGGEYLKAKRYEEAERCLKKAVHLDPNNADFHNELGRVYLATLRFANAEQEFLKAISLNSLHPFSHMHLGLVYARTGRYTAAQQMLAKGLDVNPSFAKDSYVNYAIFYSLQGMTDKSFESLEQAFQKGYKKDDTHIEIMEDTGLAPLRAQKERWEALMQKYFPDQTKD